MHKYGDVPVKSDSGERTLKEIMSQEYNEILELTVNARIL